MSSISNEVLNKSPSDAVCPLCFIRIRIPAYSEKSVSSVVCKNCGHQGKLTTCHKCQQQGVQFASEQHFQCAHCFKTKNLNTSESTSITH